MKTSIIEITSINAESNKGVSIYDALKDAIELACIERKTVILKFNDKPYTIDYTMILNLFVIEVE